MSPNYPEGYPPGIHCNFQFNGSGRERVQIQFTDFDLYLPFEESRAMRESVHLWDYLLLCCLSLHFGRNHCNRISNLSTTWPLRASLLLFMPPKGVVMKQTLSWSSLSSTATKRKLTISASITCQPTSPVSLLKSCPMVIPWEWSLNPFHGILFRLTLVSGLQWTGCIIRQYGHSEDLKQTSGSPQVSGRKGSHIMCSGFWQFFIFKNQITWDVLLVRFLWWKPTDFGITQGYQDTKRGGM